jgi:23S rRNA pseudouridine2605 synthase
VITDPESPVSIERDRFAVDGVLVAPSRKIYLVMNKPRGVVTTAADEKGRSTVLDLLGDDLPWIAPVGRLDKASEGLLLLTNDSEWAARVTDPGSHLEKTYHVQVNCVADDKLLARINRGVQDRGEWLKAKSSRILRLGEKNSWIEITLDEGRNRHIRRMLQACGVEVLRLLRISIGPLPLGILRKGEARELSRDEFQQLSAALGLPPAGKKRPKNNERVPKDVG